MRRARILPAILFAALAVGACFDPADKGAVSRSGDGGIEFWPWLCGDERLIRLAVSDFPNQRTGGALWEIFAKDERPPALTSVVLGELPAGYLQEQEALMELRTSRQIFFSSTVAAAEGTTRTHRFAIIVDELPDEGYVYTETGDELTEEEWAQRQADQC